MRHSSPSLTGRLPLLASIAVLGSLGIHMFVPAMPAAAADLAAQPTTIQLAISLYLCGLAVGQLAAGPLSDFLGRRPVLLVGIALFVVGSLGAAVAAEAWQLLAARVIQSIGGAACLLTGRAILVDGAEPHETARRLAALMSVTMISPTLAPAIGGLLVSLSGWRSIFWTFVLFGSIAGALAVALVPETLRRPAQASNGSTLVAAYGRLLRNKRFPRFVLANACMISALFIFLGASPFLLIDRYGLAPEEAGLCYLLISGGSIIGTLLVGRVERTGKGLSIGLATAVCAAASMLGFFLAGFDNPAVMVGTMLLVSVGAGIAGPTAMAGAMRCEEGLAGTASSITAAFQMVVAAIVISLMAAFGIQSPVETAAGILAATALGLMIRPTDVARVPVSVT